MLAFLQIGLEECEESRILEKLLALKEVKEAHILFGEWDALIKVEVKDTDALGDFVLEKLRTMPEINRTSTMIVAR